MWVYIEWERVEDGWVCTHTGAEVWTCSETSSAFLSSFSTFARLVPNHFKVSNHLNFSLLLDPRQSGAMQSGARKSGTRPKSRMMWRLVAAFSSPFSPLVSAGYMIFLVMPPVCRLLACNLHSISTGEKPASCLV